ncbi:Fe-S cluster assembly transcriptional regulator IscR [Neisseria shayeganii]|uniref:Iron-sulfur cluster assembly transcription regulator IscR n=2 Tax=Neisseria shayeganii TaxID=607712 RepID=G4CKC2_9NEIS|nr:Fe-S cluster assembly transcriptional regulator IscR [Neisseria shayeganii]EGY51713.1 iron-sulfur cluster assembly transcription regulator IscR [Neisseria shayeganii 871]QMT40829.1 Fe-S cluster assembly transcriptional regulator IscR [Neisseria shayeganii]
MRLTTKGRFAVTAMLDVALYGQSSPVSLNAVSERQNISLSYLEQLFGKLRRAGLVESIRGPGGGYVLGQAAAAINVAQIIDVVEDRFDATQCNGKSNCREGARCLTHDLWENLNHTIRGYLNGVSLQDLLDQKQAAGVGRTIALNPMPAAKHKQTR